MSDLLDTVVTAHGGLDRWRSATRLTAEVRAGGALWGLKGQPGVLDRYTISMDPHRQAATLAPFAEPGLRAVYTPDRVALDVFGAADRDSAHYTYEHRTVDGLVFPTRRSVHLTDERNRKVAEPVIISIDLTDITVSS